jgi:hypothetical protein
MLESGHDTVRDRHELARVPDQQGHSKVRGAKRWPEPDRTDAPAPEAATAGAPLRSATSHPGRLRGQTVQAELRKHSAQVQAPCMRRGAVADRTDLGSTVSVLISIDIEYPDIDGYRCSARAGMLRTLFPVIPFGRLPHGCPDLLGRDDRTATVCVLEVENLVVRVATLR